MPDQKQGQKATTEATKQDAPQAEDQQPQGPASTGPAGGRFIVGGKTVDANGQPIKGE